MTPREVVDPKTGLYPVNEKTAPPARVIQEVRLVGVANFVCWCFAISFVGGAAVGLWALICAMSRY